MLKSRTTWLYLEDTLIRRSKNKISHHQTNDNTWLHDPKDIGVEIRSHLMSIFSCSITTPPPNNEILFFFQNYQLISINSSLILKTFLQTRLCQPLGVKHSLRSSQKEITLTI